jgi:hypothetical protein
MFSIVPPLLAAQAPAPKSPHLVLRQHLALDSIFRTNFGRRGVVVGNTARTLIGAIIFGLAMTSAATAGPWEEVTAADQRGDYVAAVKILRRLAKSGDALAQASLGAAYSEGKGVTQDYAEAVKWYRAAAEQGNSGAQNNLGIMYDKGKGVPQDYAEAVKWYRRSAEQSNAGGQTI